MVFYVKKNNTQGVLNGGITAIVTTLDVLSGEGANFPSTYPFLITVWDSVNHPNPTDDTDLEIMEVTARSTDTLTVVRGKEGTSGFAHLDGAKVAMLITAGIFNDSVYGIEANITGDMLVATYDPTAVSGDVFDMDNMVEGTTNKILSIAERAAIVANTSAIGLNTTHRTSSGVDHSFIDQSVISGSSPILDGVNITGVLNSNVDIEIIGSPEVNNTKTLLNHHDSVGIFHSGAGAITDEGLTKFQVAAGEGFLRLTGNTESNLISMSWPQTNILYSSLVSGTTYYIYVENVAGTGTVQFTDNASVIDHIKDIDLGFIWYNAENLIFNAPTALYNLPDRQHEAMIASFGYTHVSGAAISEPANLKLGLTASNWYYGYSALPLGAIDTSVADTFTYFYRTAGVWAEVAAQTTIDTTNYNDVSTGLSALTVNRYGVHWVFLNSNGGLFVVYGIGDYTIALAEAASVPGTLPPQFDKFCKVVGKVIVQKGAASFYSLESPFVEIFTSGVALVHNNLGGLNDGDYNHLTAVQYTDLTDSGDSTIHYHATDRARANHTGTQVASTISDFDTEVSNNSSVTANTAKVTNATHTGDVTGSGALTIVGDAVSYAQMQNVVADQRILGNIVGVGGIVAELTKAQVLTMLNVEDGAAADQVLPIDSTITITDVLGNNVSTSAHGWCPKLSNVVTEYLDGQGNWSVPNGGGDALVANPLSQFAATTSAQLAGVISDETGSGLLVFATSPTLVTPLLGTPTSGVLTNCTGTAAGLTAGTVSTITGLAPDTATTAAAQSNITSLGILTTLQIDNININGNTISSTAGVDLNITPLADQQIVLDGTIVIDAGVVTGATSITSTTFVGGLTGNADTVTTNANLTGPVTSVGNATTITPDSVTYDIMQDTSGTDVVLGRSTAGAGTVEEISCTAAGRALLDDADASAQRTTLGLGSLAIQNTVSDNDFAGTDLNVNNGGTGVSTLTDGGILLGSGSGDITAMSVLAAGSLVVGDGVGDPIALVKGTGLQYLRVNTGATALEYATLSDRLVNIWLAAAAADLPQSDFTLTGTVTMTNASTVVTGSGTAFDTELKVGDYIKLDADGSAYWAKISAIATATALTIAANYGGTGGSSAGSGSGRPCGYSYVLGTGESIGYGQLELDDTGLERVGWRIPLPDVATTISLKIHWKQASAGTGNVVFKVGINGVSQGENITTLLMPTLSDSITDTALNNVTHLTIAIDGSVASNSTDDEMGILLLEVDAPNASHTLVGDVHVFGIFAEYTRV